MKLNKILHINFYGFVLNLSYNWNYKLKYVLLNLYNKYLSLKYVSYVTYIYL